MGCDEQLDPLVQFVSNEATPLKNDRSWDTCIELGTISFRKCPVISIRSRSRPIDSTL